MCVFILLTLFTLVGHFANVCPEAERLCYNCKQPGHLSAECNNPKVIEPKQCFNCGGGKIKREFDQVELNQTRNVLILVGHIQSQCTGVRSVNKTTRSKPQCFNCQQYVRLLFLIYQ